MSSLFPIVLLALLAGLGWFIMVRPMRVQRRRRAEVMEGLGPGDRVLTIGGMYGTIAAIEGAQVVLEIAPDVLVRIHVQSIQRRAEDPPAAA